MKAIRPRRPLDDYRSTAGADFWQVWTVRLPRRSITGTLVWGRVWRRHDGYRWLYAHMDTTTSELLRWAER